MNEIVWPTMDSKHLIVDSKQMLILEKEMFSDGMPQEALMEKAGIQISRWLLKKKPLLKNGITVFIGPGHNDYCCSSPIITTGPALDSGCLKTLAPFFVKPLKQQQLILPAGSAYPADSAADWRL